ncbi:MAG: polysaccharide biosynthesis protein [Mesorhizobium sp.]|uniref:polysaccharide biosynthesis protein n=1 Tax=Mesorhizobium sp. TaxID=1871066 RepID=UPI0012209439|nr:nucleoside-diphosphate sugar epimerase/dehydratase [Mesorhizobium sp.]TIM16068.1 MAG: polysaccharide biosynthesis protein [Mesorhizobium sp.]
MIAALHKILDLPHIWARRLTRVQKRFILVPADSLLIIASLWAAVATRLGTLWPLEVWSRAWWLLLVLPIIGAIIFYSIGLYRFVLRSMGRHDVIRIARAGLVLSLVLAALGYFNERMFLPRSTPIIFGLVLIGAMVCVRAGLRSYYHWLHERGSNRRPVLVYGAGESGIQLVAALDAAKEFSPVGFLDDDPSLTGSLVAGRRVHMPVDIDALLTKYDVHDVLLALPLISRSRRKEIVRFLSQRSIRVQTIPSMVELVSGVETIDRLRTVGVEELLGRDAVDPDIDLFTSVRGRAVMVTGAGGSIGSQLCREIARMSPRLLVLFEISEFSLYSIEQELNAMPGALGAQLHAVLGSVCDQGRLEQIVRLHGIETIFHAAAYKHVPLVEANPFEGIRNNTLGSECVAKVAARCRVTRVILISTDKAVRPTNVMGASKRLAELVFQRAQQSADKTTFSMVRFGNVMGSSGSVIPLFQKQIAAGGPVTVTHPDVIRYFMTIPEAAQLVIQAGSLGQGGDVFLLDMGAPVSILDLAKRMIRLSGLEVKDRENPTGDIEIIFSGLRPGEKLFEELLVDGNSTPTKHPKIMRSLDAPSDLEQIDGAMITLRSAVERSDLEAVSNLLHRLVEGYSGNSIDGGTPTLIRNSPSVAPVAAEKIVAAGERAQSV